MLQIIYVYVSIVKKRYLTFVSMSYEKWNCSEKIKNAEKMNGLLNDIDIGIRIITIVYRFIFYYSDRINYVLTMFRV